MMKVIWTLMALFSFVAVAPAMAQTTTRPIVSAGVEIYVVAPNGDYVNEVKLVLARVDIAESGRQFVNLGTKKEFASIGAEGRHFIPAEALPAAADDASGIRLVDIRAETRGFGHWADSPIRVWTNGADTIHAGSITMYPQGSEFSRTYMWQDSPGTFVIGFYARQEWREVLSVDFAFKGTAWQKAEVDFGKQTTYTVVGTDWKFVYQRFYTPQADNLGNFGGSFCGTVTIRGADVEDVRERLETKCLDRKPVELIPEALARR